MEDVGNISSIQFEEHSQDPYTRELEEQVCVIQGVIGIVVYLERRIFLVKDDCALAVWEEAFRNHLTGYGLFMMEESDYLTYLEENPSQES